MILWRGERGVEKIGGGGWGECTIEPGEKSYLLAEKL